MTTPNAITFHVSGSRALRDALVVSGLALVLGAFVAQISTVPAQASRTVPVASAPAPAAPQG
jgi:hypothetical protein